MDVILFWNEVALEANRISHTNGVVQSNNGPTRSSRALAIVHLAMYEAYARAKNNPASLPAYDSTVIPAPMGTDAQAAGSYAAHRALSILYPDQITTFDNKLSSLALNAVAVSQPFGIAVADHIYANRAADPDGSNNGYNYSQNRGSHQQDPYNPGNDAHGARYGDLSSGFAITARHQLDPHPAVGSNEYNKALRQVKAKGIAPELAGTLPTNSFYRTPEQTLMGIYWGYDGASGLGTPPRLYNLIIRKVAMEQGNTEDRNARLFALVNVAMGDAGILAWEQKYKYNFMRPVVGIREGDKSLGKDAVGNNNISPDSDPIWLPLGAPATNNTNKKNFTPPFPAYPSGHATFGAAAFQITRLFYGISGETPDDLLNGKYFVSEEFDGISYDNAGAVRPRHARNFPDGGLWQMIVENGLSRIYLGVHWSFDAFALNQKGEPDLSQNIGGVPLGLRIAEDIFNSGMKKSNIGPVV